MVATVSLLILPVEVLMSSLGQAVLMAARRLHEEPGPSPSKLRLAAFSGARVGIASGFNMNEAGMPNSFMR